MRAAGRGSPTSRGARPSRGSPASGSTRPSRGGKPPQLFQTAPAGIAPASAPCSSSLGAGCEASGRGEEDDNPSASPVAPFQPGVRCTPSGGPDPALAFSHVSTATRGRSSSSATSWTCGRVGFVKGAFHTKKFFNQINNKLAIIIVPACAVVLFLAPPAVAPPAGTTLLFHSRKHRKLPAGAARLAPRLPGLEL